MPIDPAMTPISNHYLKSGFTLLELLIAIVVLSVGLLGVASLQLISLKNNQSTLFHSEASVLAYNIIDRMRVNRKEVVNYSTGGSYWNYGSNCATAKLTGSNLYVKDINDWLQTLCKRLPSGQGKIAIDSSKSQIVVSVQWDDSRGIGQTSGAIRTITVQSQYCTTLPCNF